MTSRRHLIILPALILKSLSYWLWSFHLRGSEAVDHLLMFRPWGDSDYYQQVAGLSHLQFGETVVKEMAGTGFRSFPFGSVAVHSLFFRFAGVYGFIAADVLFTILFYLALKTLLLRCGVTDRISQLVAFAAALELPRLVQIHLPFLNKELAIDFWGTRFPRPMVTEVIVLFLLAILVNMTGRKEWWLVGLMQGLLVQSDLHQAIVMSKCVTVVVLWLIVVQKTPLREMLANIGRMAVAGTIIMTPFLIQRLYEHPDIPRRFGVFPVDRAHLIWDPDIFKLLLSAIIGSLLCFAVYRFWCGKAPALPIAASFLALLAGPYSMAVLGKTIQPYHFGSRAALLNGYVWLIAAGLLATAVFSRWKRHGQTVETALFFATLTMGLFHASSDGEYMARDERPVVDSMRMDEYAGDFSHYKTSFLDLTRELERPQYASSDVMATFDASLSNWWAFRGHHLYLPDAFNSTVPDSVIEDRLLNLASLLQVTPSDFQQLIRQPFILWRVIGADKYQASSAYTFARFEDYEPAAQALILKSTSNDSWQVAMPISEQNRFLKKYAEHPAVSLNPNILVLAKDARRSMLHPRQDQWRLGYENERFEVWSPK